MRRRVTLLRPVLILGAAFAIAVVAVLFVIRVDRVVVVKGRMTGGTVAVYAPYGGHVDRVLVQPGDRVEKGQPLVEMQSGPLRAEESQLASRIEVLTLRLENERAERDRMLTHVHRAESEQARRAIEKSRLELGSAETRFQLTKQLREEGLATKLEYDAAELAFKLAALALEQAEEESPLLLSRQRAELDTRAKEIQALEGQIAEERAALTEIRRKLSLASVCADTSSVVLGTRLFDLEGQTVNEGDELLRLSVGSAVRFEGLVSDNGRALARAGLPVKIRLEGYPWLIHGSMAGRLDFIADRRDDGAGFPVKISFDPSTAPGPVYEGMAGQARIVVEKKVLLGRLIAEKVAGTQKP